MNILKNNNKRDSKSRELFYNELAPIWQSKINNSETNKRLKIIFNKLLPKNVIVNKKFLEVGCGLGYFSNKAWSLGAKVSGIDIGPNLIIINKKKTPKATFKVSSASKLPFKDGLFDVVLSTEVIEHVDNQPKALKEMFRVLKNDGYLAITTPNRIYKPLFDILGILRIRPYHGNEDWYYPWDLKNKLSKFGIIKKEVYFNFLFPNKFFDYFENISVLKYLMINQGYLVIKK